MLFLSMFVPPQTAPSQTPSFDPLVTEINCQEETVLPKYSSKWNAEYYPGSDGRGHLLSSLRTPPCQLSLNISSGH